MPQQREYQEGDIVRVYGAREMTHVNGGGMRMQRGFKLATFLRRDEQYGRNQCRVRYHDTSREDVVAQARLELVDQDAA